MAEEEAYQQRTFKPTEKGWSGDPLTKFTELLGGSIPYVAAPLIAGGAAAVGGAPALVATGLGALASGAQFTGQFLKRQTEEGTPLEQTNLAAAAGAGTVAGADEGSGAGAMLVLVMRMVLVMVLVVVTK
jgi:hypothetical protein